MYCLPPELLRPGTPHCDIIRHRITIGILIGETSDSAAKQVLSALVDELSSARENPAASRAPWFDSP
jgi:hypothetical protein